MHLRAHVRTRTQTHHTQTRTKSRPETTYTTTPPINLTTTTDDMETAMIPLLLPRRGPPACLGWIPSSDVARHARTL